MVIVIVLVVNVLLNKYTNHGKEFAAPYLVNSSLEGLATRSDIGDINIVIIDSIYNKNYEPGIVLQQMPKAGSAIKPGRKVYVVVSSVSPGQTKMPNILDVTVRQAVNALEAAGLFLGEIQYKPAFDKDAVQSQLFNGVDIAPGTAIQKGSVIDLVVGAGFESMVSHMPFLYGENVLSAREMIRSSYLNVGNEYFLDTDELEDAIVYKCIPEWSPDSLVAMGTKVDVYYRSQKRASIDSIKFVMRFPSIHRETSSILYADSFNRVPYESIQFDTLLYVMDSVMFMMNDSLIYCDSTNFDDFEYNFDNDFDE